MATRTIVDMGIVNILIITLTAMMVGMTKAVIWGNIADDVG
jgi:hypothetical protein